MLNKWYSRRDSEMTGQIQIALGVMMLVLTLAITNPVKAQPGILAASPARDEIVATPPTVVSITFDRVLDIQRTTIQVTNAHGEQVDEGSPLLDPADRRHISVRLKPLTEDVYTVSYSVTALGGSVFSVDSYSFTFDLPDATLELIAPVNGAAYRIDEPVSLNMRTQFFDFGFYENRIRIYVDDVLHAEIESVNYDLVGLEPGVHVIKTVLTQFSGQELPNTAILVTVAIANADPEAEGLRQAAQAVPDPGLKLTVLQVLGIITATGGLLAVGCWLAQKQP
jgi:methionine-rich copper-binding protein CopC